MIKKKKWISAFLLMLLIILYPAFGLDSFAADDPMIIVSMGDSYSSGEGVTPYYGQEKPLDLKIRDRDWLAHRSTLAWPALLKVPGYGGIMSDYRQVGKSNADCQWYFVASAGAVTSDIYSTQQKVSALKVQYTAVGPVYYSYSDELPTQISIFDEIEGKVDYVTLTIGGNDLGFGKIVESYAKHSSYLGSAPLDKKTDELWGRFDEVKADLTETYKRIQEAAGPQAAIIVAGYPQIIGENSKCAVVNREEAIAAGLWTARLDEEMAELVRQLSDEGMNIHYVSVIEAFNEGNGHQAYTDDPWVSGFIKGSVPEEIYDIALVSGSSLHPNYKGSLAYAECVNAKIKELEEAKKTGKLSGTVINAYSQGTAVSSADIKIYDMNNRLVYEGKTDLNGEFIASVAAGEYRIVVSASGYDSSTSHATVTKDNETSAKVLMFPAGQSCEIGTVIGRARNNDTGSSVSEIKVTARKGRDNYTGAVVATTTGDNKGNYTLTLPVGEYSLTFEKEGFVIKVKNIVVSGELTDNQTIWMKPGMSCTVIGRARNNDTGTSVSGVRVSARNGWDNYVGGVVASATGDNKGNYSLILPAGEYCLTFEKEGFVTKSRNISVQGELTDNQTIWMLPGINCTVIGRARDNDTGSSVPGIKVSFRRGRDNYTGAVVASATGDNKGNYSAIVSVGEYCLTFEKAGYVTKTKNIIVSEEFTDNQTTWMKPGINCTVIGKIRSNATGSSVPGVKVSARKGRDNYTGAVMALATADNKGNYSLVLPSGEYCLTFEKAGYVTKTKNIVISEELTDNQTTWMSPETSKAMADDWTEELTEELTGDLIEEQTPITGEADVSGDSAEIPEAIPAEESVSDEEPEEIAEPEPEETTEPELEIREP